jgi:hypothetical protein
VEKIGFYRIIFNIFYELAIAETLQEVPELPVMNEEVLIKQLVISFGDTAPAAKLLG